MFLKIRKKNKVVFLHLRSTVLIMKSSGGEYGTLK